MKVIIPMAGQSKRFTDVFFMSPKPLLEIDGRPMIELVTKCFPRDSEFIFLCNEEHLKTTNLRSVLERIVPNKRIIVVSQKFLEGPVTGPVVSCLPAFDLISDDEEIIINYCDFIQIWDFDDFIKTARSAKCHGAIVSFKGFHPASLGTTYYAYMKVKGNRIVDLREKQNFTSDRTNEYASTGTYYFASGALFKKYAHEVIEQKINVGGEMYTTLPLMLMIRDGLNIMNYEVDKFICLGTPRDYETYKFWSEVFVKYSMNDVSFNNVNVKTTNLFPVAGGEKHFGDAGIDCLNFLIPIMNKNLLHYCLPSFPQGIRNIFIALNEFRDEFNESYIPEKYKYNSKIFYLDKKTGGNAETIYSVRRLVKDDEQICISGTNYILDYDNRRLSHMMEKKDIDIILFSFSHHECVLRNPKKYAYAKIKNNIEVAEIVEKEPISDAPYLDHAMTGTAIIKCAGDLFGSIERKLKTGDLTKMYFLTILNDLIKQGKKVVIFEVDKFISLASPLDYKEFLYWQDYFDKVSHHPYSKMIQ